MHRNVSRRMPSSLRLLPPANKLEDEETMNTIITEDARESSESPRVLNLRPNKGVAWESRGGVGAVDRLPRRQSPGAEKWAENIYLQLKF
jgi:hypothetical protein